MIASPVWTGGTLEWSFIVGGGAWIVVQAIVFSGSALEWVSFATALVAAGIAAVGLTIHEMTTERVVEELSVVSAGERPQRAARA